MNKIQKVSLVIMSVAVAIFLFISISVALFGKKILVSQITQNLKMESSLGGMSFGLPFTVNLYKLEIGDLIKAERVSVSPSILGFLAGKVVINGLTLVDPEINITQSADGKLNLPVFEQKQKGKAAPVYLTGLVIKNGKFIFTDKKLTSEGYKVILDKINLSVSKIMLPPTSLYTKFNLSAEFVDLQAKPLGSVGGMGWVDFGPKNMEGDFQVKDLEVVYFTPYLGSLVSDKQLLSAKLNFYSALKAKNNDLQADNHLELANIVYAKQVPQEGALPDLGIFKKTLDIFADAEGKVKLDFSIRTQLDNPAIDPANLQKVMLEAAAKNITNQPPEKIIEKVSDTIEQFKSIGEGLKDLF